MSNPLFEHMKKVIAFFDGAVGMWVAHSDDIPGLNTEAPSFEQLRLRIKEHASDLLLTNRSLIADPSPSFEIVVQDSLVAA